jgi:gliding motility-associated-like protein
MLKKIIVCFTVLLPHLAIKAQNVNPCGVKAVLVPGGDSIVNTFTNVHFQSASVNATSYKILVDNINYGENTPVTLGIQVGLTAVKLVAYKGGCTDTATAYYFYPGKAPADTDNSRRLYGVSNKRHRASDLIATSSGGHVIVGLTDFVTAATRQKSVVIKTKEAGCVEWARITGGANSSYITKITEAADGGYFMTGDDDFNRYIAKIDASGNLLWATEPELFSYSASLTGFRLAALPDGGVVVTGRNTGSYQPVVMRLTTAGKMVWQKEYTFRNGWNANTAGNIVYKDNCLYVGGDFSNGLLPNTVSAILKIDAASGKTLWVKQYTHANALIIMGEITDGGSALLVNITTPTSLPNTPAIGGIMRLDTAGQVLKTTMVGESYSPGTPAGPFTKGTTMLVKSGKTYYLISPGTRTISSPPYSSNTTKFIRFDSTGNVIWMKESGAAEVPGFCYNAAADKEGMAFLVEETGSAISPQSNSVLLGLKLVDSSGGNANAACYLANDPFVVQPVAIVQATTQLSQDLAGDFRLYPYALSFAPFYPEMRYKCPDYVDSCSYLKISGPSAFCNLSEVYTYKVHKNKGCGQPTQWTLPSATQLITQTDSSITLRFTEYGKHTIIGANPLSCTPVMDSIVVIATYKPTPPLNLGPDLQICRDNSVTFHAGHRFLLYEWQDGTADSVLTINKAGKYWVRVADSCGNVLSDTVVISEIPIPLSIGIDRTKCNNDTVHLQAEAGFINYSWGPLYNINSTASREVIVNPLVNTNYHIKAEKTPGCFAYDTINITVHHSPGIALGNDTSFCSGDSVWLDAGAGFAAYKWSNGTALQKVPAFQKGTYSVIATTAENCASYDTLTVLTIYAKPVVELGTDNTLCVGGTRLLQADPHASQVWQDGSTGSSYAVTRLGTYFVAATNSNHCISRDTININQVVLLPARFLPVDTAICSYGTLNLKTPLAYKNYLWSNGATTASIRINTPGTYWLQATDYHNCSGKDTIVVSRKDCMVGLYMPTAFTPNNDGKNDVLRPLLFGDIRLYHFSVYNRFGQLVFESSDPGKGWNGTFKGHSQDGGTFIWQCRYQLAGEVVKMEKGTVILLR